VDTIATTTNPNQADDPDDNPAGDPVGDPAEAALQRPLIGVDDAQSAKPGRLSGQQHDATDADGTADCGSAADQPGGPHHLGRRVGARR
jgi:hypothetical protein